MKQHTLAETGWIVTLRFVTDHKPSPAETNRILQSVRRFAKPTGEMFLEVDCPNEEDT